MIPVLMANRQCLARTLRADAVDGIETKVMKTWLDLMDELPRSQRSHIDIAAIRPPIVRIAIQQAQPAFALRARSSYPGLAGMNPIL